VRYPRGAVTLFGVQRLCHPCILWEHANAMNNTAQHPRRVQLTEQSVAVVGERVPMDAVTDFVSRALGRVMAADRMQGSSQVFIPTQEVPVKVLVVYGSRRGATAGVATRIAARINEDGLQAEARPLTEVDDMSQYDAVVLGSAAYIMGWLKDGTALANRHRRGPQARKVWLLNSGPLEGGTVDEDGVNVLKSARAKEFTGPQAMPQPRGSQVFFGAGYPEAPPEGISERLLRFTPASKEALPAGDFPDWEAIDAWADAIAAELKSGSASAYGAGQAD
jgi:menaquinone-dependent protoporphyrinogen oxidase